MGLWGYLLHGVAGACSESDEKAYRAQHSVVSEQQTQDVISLIAKQKRKSPIQLLSDLQDQGVEIIGQQLVPLQDYRNTVAKTDSVMKQLEEDHAITHPPRGWEAGDW